MAFEVLDSLSLPGDPAKPNEDAFAAEPFAALVLDGATTVSDPLLPGRSDAAWIAQFGARRLLAHLKEGDSPRAALRHALADAEHSFEGLRRRPPRERYEMPCASMMLASPRDGGFNALWYGDCAALVLRPGETCEIVGHALDKKAAEAADAARFAAEKAMAPVGVLARDEFLPYFRAGRGKVNTPGGTWLFAPMAEASEHVSHASVAAPPGTLILICSDGFLALVGDYGLYDAATLVRAAQAQGLKALGEELRAVEDGDPEGRKFPRFKKSDDATAVLVKAV
jgi:hypothetical protein